MTHQKDCISLVKFVFDDNNQLRKSWSYLGQSCYRYLIVFLFQLFVFLLTVWLLLENLLVKNFGRINCLVGNPVLCSTIHFTLTKKTNKINSTKKRVFLCLLNPSKKITFYLKLAQKRNISINNWPNLLFLSTLLAIFRCYAKWDKKIRFCWWCNFWI